MWPFKEKMHEKMEDSSEGDVCRVCRSEGGSDRPLFHPCICTGSIRYIHQDCLVQWLKHSKKEYCELCMHKFIFAPIYSPDMPPRLPLRDIAWGLVRNFGTAVLCWVHYTMVIFAWLGVVPVTASRIYGCLFNTSLAPVLTLPFDIFSLEKMATDILQGCFVVGCTLCALISLVLLREQVAHGGGPGWLEDPPGEQAPGGVAGAGGGGQQQQQGGVAEGVLERALRGFANNNNNQGQAAQNQQNNGGVRQRNGQAANNAPRQEGRGLDGEEQRAEGGAENEGRGRDGGAGGGAGGGVEGHEADPEPAANNQADDNAGHDDINWNALEWDRAAEALTWEELLGLDGSLVFLENVYWVTVLNALFIFLFAFCPYHIGGISTLLMGWQEAIKKTHFEGLITTMLGYICLAALLILCHSCSRLLKFFQAGRLFGLCYVVLKVFLLVVLEIGVFPLICGWWLDVCSLSLFDVSIQERLQGFNSAPGTATFLHWLVGMAYVFYFASFILLLREVLRPGVLWFLRNLNDPDFNPIQEMIHLPVHRHARRFVLSVIVFGSVVLLMVWLPVSLVRRLLPTFLPYHMHLSGDTAVTELSLELLLLQVVLPALLEQGHTRLWLKNLIRYWTIMAAYLLDLRSYLLGDVPINDELHDGNAEHETEDDGEEEEEGEEEEVEIDEDSGIIDALIPEDTEMNVNVERTSLQNSEDRIQAAYQNLARATSEAAESNNPVDGSLEKSEYGTVEGAVGGESYRGESGVPYLQLRREHEDSDVEMREEERDAETMVTEDIVNDGEGENGLVDGEEEEEEEGEGVEEVVHVMDQEEPIDIGGGLHAAHHAMINNRQPTHFEPYNRPQIFHLRVVLLVGLLCLTLLLASLACLTLPVLLGRRIMGLWVGPGATVHELYTGACGLYVCWLAMRVGTVLATWMPQGVELLLHKVKEYAALAWKSVLVAVMLLGVVPLLLGLLFELVVVIPQRVQLDQTPVFFLRQDWALGVLQAKILCALTMMGPSWWLKDVLEQVYQDGLRQLNLTFITRRLALPVTVCLLVALTAPYTFAVGIFPLFGFDEDTNHQMARRIYPLIVSTIVGASLVIFQAKQFKKLYEHIKNDKYLVGQQLVNYEPKSVRDNATQTAEH